MDDLVIQALQKQLNHERANAQKYYFMAMGFDNMAYPGFAKLFKSQADGEMGHAAQVANMLIAKRIMPEYLGIAPVILDAGVKYYAQVALQTELLTTEALKQGSCRCCWSSLRKKIWLLPSSIRLVGLMRMVGKLLI
jgi:ferritin